MVKLYNENEYIFTTKTLSTGQTFNNVLCDTNGNIISGNNHFIGRDEKRRNKTILHIDFPYTSGNYALFYVKQQERLVAVCNAIDYLLNNPQASEREKAPRYAALIQNLHIVHHISTREHSSKLNGINSLSTCCLDNLYCIERINNHDSICAHCYAATQQKCQLQLQDVNTINGIILRNIVIPAKYWKKHINPADLSKYFRIESFGDVQNKNQALNYLQFMTAFPRIRFAVWTKNTGIWAFAMEEAGKPANMAYIVSSNKVNQPEMYHLDTYGNIDHIFTVYDKQFIKATNIPINCGGHSCMECIKRRQGCYFRGADVVINEQLK